MGSIGFKDGLGFKMGAIGFRVLWSLDGFRGGGGSLRVSKMGSIGFRAYDGFYWV